MAIALITGTSGFIGGKLAEVMSETYEVIRLNRRPNALPFTSLMWDMSGPLPDSLPSKVDLILHVAATDGRQMQNPFADCFQVNTVATAELLAYAKRANAKQFIYFSTGSVYPLAEKSVAETDVVQPLGPYASSKSAAECLVAGYAEMFATLTLRLFYPYGAGQRLPRLIPGLIHRIQRGDSIQLHGKLGKPEINPVHLSDLIQWTLKLIEKEATGTFNMAGSETVSIRGLAELIAKLAGMEVRFDIKSGQQGNRLGDITRIIAATGYQPQQSLRSGLEAMLAGPVL